MSEPAYWIRNEDGTFTAYNEDGSPTTYPDGSPVLPPGGGGFDAPVYAVNTDPQTQQKYTSRWHGSGHSDQSGRDSRRSRRKREEAEKQARIDYYGRGATDATNAIDDPWNELEGYIPSYDDLMGDEYTATMGEAEADPMAIAAQRAALQRLGQQARTGYTAEDYAMEQQARSDSAQYERQQREALMQQAAMRGMTGAGTTLGAQLAAQQAGANRQSQASLDVAANAQRRALQALQAQNAAAGQIRGQSFNEDSARRSAVDEANRYMIDGQRAASRDQFGMRGQVAQGQSQAAATQAEQNLALKQDAAGTKTKKDKNTEIGMDAAGKLAEFF